MTSHEPRATGTGPAPDPTTSPTPSTKRKALPVLPSGGVDAGAVHVARALEEAGVDGLEAGTRVAMVTLGCDKNTVDSERILSSLLGAGVELADSPEDADVVIVNTCGFIEMAKQESIDTLLQAARLKEAGRVRAVVGMGCLVQRYKPELEEEMPEVDMFLGLSEADRLVPKLAERGLVDIDPNTPLMERPLRVLSSASGAGHSSHLKISEGCDHGCAFCAIPLMRGRFRSTPLDILVREAQELEAAGVVELNIVSQDTSWYGRDWARALARGEEAPVWSVEGESWFLGRPFDRMPNVAPPEAVAPRDAADTAAGVEAGGGGDDPRRSSFTSKDGGGPVRPGPTALDGIERTGALPLLLRTLLAETRVPWYRLFYMYPSGITPELVALMAAEDRILPYLDMPIQHGSDAVLKRMRRPERRETILERVGWLRDAIPDLALRTTVIVGFPGETEEDFEALLELLEEVRFDHVGGFAYSEEEDTPAAEMPDPVPPAVRRERLARLMDVQRGISLERNEARVGSVVTVLVDEVGDGGAVARAPWQAPEVDGVVTIPGADGLEPGRFVEVAITAAGEEDLTARVVR
ncbi:MAG: MiaB/RimO family radical SAM methylthiotransferase [Longimicrobiales bacterium]